MDQELKNQLMKYLEKAESAADSAGNFVLEQAPDVIRQFLAWEFYSAVFFIVLSLLFMIPLIWNLLWSIKVWKDSEKEGFNGTDSGLIAIWIALSFMSIFIPIIPISCNAYYATKVYVAPKVVLMEKAAELVKGAK